MEGVVNVEWHGQDYLHLKWHVVYSGFATPDLHHKNRENTKFQLNWSVTIVPVFLKAALQSTVG